MPRDKPKVDTQQVVGEFVAGRGGLPQLWGRRGFWQVRLRWGVAPAMIAGLLIGKALGFEYRLVPILLIAISSPLYNSFFAWIYSRHGSRLEEEPRLDRLVTILEVIADYTAMFLLIHYTGGMASPLVYFFVFHVIIGAIQFSPVTAYTFAGLAAGGLTFLQIGEASGWLPCHCLTFRGVPIHFMDRPVYSAVMLLFYTATLFLSAAMVTRIMRRLRERVGELTRTGEELSRVNEELRSLYTMVCAIGDHRHLEPMLATVTAELAKVTGVPAAAVKLLAEDGRSLRYVAAHGLPEDLVRDSVVTLDQSPLNRRVIEGETLVKASLNGDDALQLRRELREAGIRSAVLTPLTVRGKVIGTLGFYARTPDRFTDRDATFLKLAAELVAIAIDDAQAYEAIEKSMHERAQFMLQVAHNLRAPLGAGLSMLELLSGGYLGDVEPRQVEYLQRLDGRLRSLDQTIAELLTIARTRDWSREIPDVVVDIGELAAHTERTFRDEAAAKGIDFEVVAEGDLRSVDSGADLLEKVMENLVSNAVKYTPEGGRVTVLFSAEKPEEVRIEVRDTGIGIPRAEQDKLFKEFFRASNAKKVAATGSGLGLALVKQSVERHHGRLQLQSEEGEGTTVTIDLPRHQTKSPSD